jgi:hypothetical protein
LKETNKNQHSAKTNQADNEGNGMRGFLNRIFGGSFSLNTNKHDSNISAKQKENYLKSQQITLQQIESNLKKRIDELNQLTAEYNPLVPMTAQLYGFHFQSELKELKESIDKLIILDKKEIKSK